MMRELHSGAQAALNAVCEEVQGRERYLLKRHEAQIAEFQARAPPTFGGRDQALEDAKAEDEWLKSDLLGIDQDVADKQAEVEY